MSPWRQLAAQVVGGRRWVVAIGATEVFAIAASVGIECGLGRRWELFAVLRRHGRRGRLVF